MRTSAKYFVVVIAFILLIGFSIGYAIPLIQGEVHEYNDQQYCEQFEHDVASDTKDRSHEEIGEIATSTEA